MRLRLLTLSFAPLTLLLAACSPKIAKVAPAAAEPVIRVHLRSMGGTWTALRYEGKQGQTVLIGARRYESDDPLLLRRSAGDDRIELEGIPGSHASLSVEPEAGVFKIGDQTYSGRLEWLAGKFINHVRLENYVLGVLRGELPLPEVSPAAAEAQAIAARSYALHHIELKQARFDLDDTTLFQRYVGLDYAPDDAHLRQGVQRSRGLYLRFDKKPLKAYYHSTCGGHTTDVRTGLDRENVAPMMGVACDYCVKSKYYRWEATLTGEDIRKAAGLTGKLAELSVAEEGSGGRARTLQLVGADAAKTVNAAEFRLKMGPSNLRSTRILEIRRVDGSFFIKGAGWGHGVGLCQMGAVGQGRQGVSGEQIAEYYYPGATIRRAY
ncbi:MAG: SpoIID/LytB domain-containing protein [Planctomycetota bacterium]